MTNRLRHSPTEHRVVPEMMALIERREAERLALSGLAKAADTKPETDEAIIAGHESAETLSPEAGPPASDD